MALQLSFRGLERDKFSSSYCCTFLCLNLDDHLHRTNHIGNSCGFAVPLFQFDAFQQLLGLKL